MRVYRQYLLSLLTLMVLLLFLMSLWLPQGTVQDWDCQRSWIPCLHPPSDTKVDTVVPRGPVPPRSEDEYNVNEIGKGVCPGQNFQVSHLLLHLNTALDPASDILLEPYLLCWEELIKFMEALGPLFSLFTGKVQEKIVVIRRLMEEESARNAHDPKISQNPQVHAYISVRSMLEAELQRGVVSFDRQTDSGSRTLLRLHRSLLWLQMLLEKLLEGGPGDGAEGGDGGRSLGVLCAEAYEEALAPHHPWFLQQAAHLVFRAMPSRAALLRIVCVTTQEEAEPIIHTIINTIREVHHRTQRELEQRHMMNLP
ncbi:ceramide-1-phosphate transfer protein [Hoplias malabaricus]|uniref:ceramide-1-phosphate transfer protein n=1 Tax=Hoplias malabaricus TaxID=27720 RepID=UPI003462964C